MEDWVSVLLSFFKFLSIGLTGAFGAIGLMTEFRNKRTKKITNWGKIVLTGIVASTLISAISQALENEKNREEDQKSDQKTRTQLHEIQRAVEPLDSISFWYWIDADLTSPLASTYKARIKPVIDRLRRPQAGDENGAWVSLRGIDGTAKEISISASSPWFPRETDAAESAVFHALRYPDFLLAVNRSPISSIQKKLAGQTVGLQPNLLIHSSQCPKDKLQLIYRVVSSSFVVTCETTTVPPDLWQNDGSIASSIDFEGATVVVAVESIVHTGDGRIDQDIDALRRSLIPETVIIGLPRGRSMTLRAQALTRTRNDDGLFILRV